MYVLPEEKNYHDNTANNAHGEWKKKRHAHDEEATRKRRRGSSRKKETQLAEEGEWQKKKSLVHKTF